MLGHVVVLAQAEKHARYAHVGRRQSSPDLVQQGFTPLMPPTAVCALDVHVARHSARGYHHDVYPVPAGQERQENLDESFSVKSNLTT